MSVTSDTLVHLAESMGGVADMGDASVAAFVSPLGNHLAQLARRDGRAAVIEAVSELRPDYVLLGGPVGEADLVALAAAMKTASMGVLVLGSDMAADMCVPPLLELEAIDPAKGLGGFTLRLRGLMRRCRPVALAGRRSAGGVTLDEAAMTLGIGGASMPLSLEDFRLLGPLFDCPAQVWSREALLDLAYGTQTANALRTVDVKLNRTRRRVRAALGHDPIRSVRGVGYTLDPGS